ncbi:TetR/AcrR family transcriptional regulator [Streptomyces sp. NPDC001530]|uniref:TetR/AcrR family transcriptional regulator n=1 Tax=Streptomyces sp. NPDC001530 TaxID=3364582 RepID=UPI0036D1EDA8
MAERADAARNRRAILAAAERLLVEGAPASMDDVARAAGVGKGTVFRRFGSRSGLLQALVAQYDEEIDKAARQALDDSPDPRQQTLTFVDKLFDIRLERCALWAALEGDLEATHDTRGACDQVHTRLTGFIERARPDGDAAFFAHCVIAAMRIDLVTQLSESGHTDAKEIREKLREFTNCVLTGSTV